jgi:ribosomal protein S18 acetylase RimI-like enzyme
LQIHVRDARTHRPEEYANFFRGYRALVLTDDSSRTRGELVWRLATGHTVEITEFGIYAPEDRRQGWGSMLLEAGMEDMHRFFREIGRSLRRVYLFSDSTNDPGRAFYNARGFQQEAVLKDFYHYCDAILYVRSLEEGNS